MIRLRRATRNGLVLRREMAKWGCLLHEKVTESAVKGFLGGCESAMTKNEPCIEKFQRLLRELFQFDAADLDFGIYRIMNCKRSAVEQFITEELPKAVAEELDRGALKDQSLAAIELKDLAQRIRALDPNGIDADGNLAESYRGTELGDRYQKLMSKAAGGRGREAIEATVYNHLSAFFGRYYQDGDFISKRRDSKRQKYSIPYNGEEVNMYWANSDQYYVKTTECFRDYAFTSRGTSVHFRLRSADSEQDDVRGDRRFFIPLSNEASWDSETEQVVVPFEYRPLTRQEEIAYGSKRQQDAMIQEALEAIPKRLKRMDRALAALVAEHHRSPEGDSVTYLEHHLRQYAKRNTSDFFIHRDLRGFLLRELDFYIKNEVLSIDEMQIAGEDRAESWFQVMSVIGAVGARVIDFLDQVESFQKVLWEKRKFITETQYCITVGSIDESFRSEIAECEAQWSEWKELLHLDEEETNLFTSARSKQDRRLAFLQEHPTLAIDTRHFDSHFVDKLLASFDDLDDETDGLLIHSENWQALALLLEKYRAAIGAVYIDPPYNTFATKIIYKNEYEHSSWLSLLENRLVLAHNLLAPDGIACTTIDDYELHRLVFLLERIYGADNHLATVVIRNNPSGRSTVKGFAINHEYGLFFCRSSESAAVGRLPHTDAQRARYSETDEEGLSFEWENFRKSSAGSYRSDRPRQYFPLYCQKETLSLRVPKMEWEDEARSWRVLEEPDTEELAIWPLDDTGRERVWRYGLERTRRVLTDARVEETASGFQVYTKKYLQARGSLPRTWWDKSDYSARDNGTRALADLFGSEKPFDFPKAPAAVADSIRVCSPGDGGVVLDYFAGSGTTAQAVIGLNREDDEGLSFILVEVGDYFDTVLLPRIKKITFTPEWRKGRPRRAASEDEAERSPRVIKYLRIESYEDALSNIAFDEESGQHALGLDDYLIKYMFQWETRGSATLLNVKELAKPFSYKLRVFRDGQTSERIADVPETFVYLLGLHVQTRKVYFDEERRYLVYRGRVDHRQVAIIWRETEGWQEADLQRDKEFVVKQGLTDGADEILVNGDSLIPDAKSLEPTFKARMLSTVEG